MSSSQSEAATPSADGQDAARAARLARKAEAARLARLRHKQYVADKQAEVAALREEEAALLAEEAAASGAALEEVKSELRRTLAPEQLELLASWLCEAEGGGGAALVETYVHETQEGVAPPLPPLKPPAATVPAASDGL